MIGKAVHQLVHTLSYGDAISSEVLALQRCLSALGFESEIYAINVHPRYKGKAKLYKEFPESFDGQVLLHYSLGSPLNALYRRLAQAEKCLIFHNLTPASWFVGINPGVARDIEQGRAELPELCRISQKLIADSQFNAEELSEFGFHARVLELAVDPERWTEPANPGISALLKGSGELHVLHVGRIAPNKCLEDLLKTFYFLHCHGERKSRLWLPGIDIDTELYAFSLKRLARELGIEDAVEFPGCMADSEIRALYENSTAYVCMSEHEGFCLPVVEAMRFGLPVLAFASSALPQTVGSGGILFREKRHAEIAELILEIRRDTELREKLIKAGYERVKDLSLEKFSMNVASIFGSPHVQRAAAMPQEPGLCPVVRSAAQGE